MDNSAKVENDKESPKKYSKLAGLIVNKRIPEVLVMILFYLCLCFGSWFMTRRKIAYILTTMPQLSSMQAVIGNDIVCFLLSGIIPFAVFTLGRFLAFNMLLKLPVSPQLNSMVYDLKIHYGLGYLIYGAFSMLYFAVPLMAFYGELIVRFLIVGGFIALYLRFETKYRLPSILVPKAIYAVGGSYTIINLVAAIYMIIEYLV